MEQRPFGRLGVAVPVIGEGTWNMERDSRSACVTAIHRALDAGATHIDTAELYGSGRVEEIVGEALAGRRDEAFLVSKVLPSHASYAGTLSACEASLRRLRAEYLDCYLLHWTGSEPLEETIRAFEALSKAGKIRSYGVSNFDEKELAKAVRLAGPDRIVCNQVLYHLGERAIEHAVIPACERHGVAVVAYSPFGSGHFPSARSAGGKVLADIASAHGVTPRAIALRFLLRWPSMFAIPKAAEPNHVDANARAGDLRLTEAELERIDEAFPLGCRRSGVPTL